MKIEDYFWITEDGTKIRMVDLDAGHLRNAHTHTCNKEYEHFYKQNIFNSLREKIEEVAKFRNVELKYPDERFPSKKWGNYFKGIRKMKEMVEPKLEPIKKEAILASNTSKEIDSL